MRFQFHIRFWKRVILQPAVVETKFEALIVAVVCSSSLISIFLKCVVLSARHRRQKKFVAFGRNLLLRWNLTAHPSILHHWTGQRFQNLARWQKNVFGLAGIFNDFLFEAKTKELCNFKIDQIEICDKNMVPPFETNRPIRKTLFSGMNSSFLEQWSRVWKFECFVRWNFCME